jgi:hypothetical protein
MVLYAWRALCVGTIGIGLFCAYALLAMGLEGLITLRGEMHWFFLAILGACMILGTGGLAYVSARYGYRGARYNDPKSVTGLTAVAWVVVSFTLSTLADQKIPSRTSDFEEALSFSGLFFFALLGVIGYWFTYRFLLRALGQACPPLQDSLSKGIFAVLGLILWLALSNWVRYIVPDSDALTDRMTLVKLGASLAAIVIPMMLYQKAVRAFATPFTPYVPSPPAKPTGLPPSMNIGTEP